MNNKNTIKQHMLALVLPIFVAMMFSFSADNNCSWVSGYNR